MPFRPDVHAELIINGTTYRVAPHPQSLNYPFAQEGGRATVYRLDTPYASKALKVFKQLYRTSQIATTTTQLFRYATLTGLGVCERDVLHPSDDGTPPLNEPDLAWSVLMPWVEGATWYDMLIETDERKRNIDLTTMRTVVQKFLNILLEMELNAVTHCDLSPGNILVRFRPPEVDLIDVEEICAVGIPMPEILPKGTPGYTHRSAVDGLWNPYADRFAGAILLCEMICWSDVYFRSHVFGDSFFDPDEMQTDTLRYQVMVSTLTKLGGMGLATLFERCWFAPNLSDMPAFWEWAQELQGYFNKSVLIQPPIQAKFQAQLHHTIQEIELRLQTLAVQRDGQLRAAYQRLHQQMLAEAKKIVGSSVAKSPTTPLRAVSFPQKSSATDMSVFPQILTMASWRRMSFVVGITLISVIIAGFIVFGLLKSNTPTQAMLPQVVITILPNNETLTPSHTSEPTLTQTQMPTFTVLVPTSVPTNVPTVKLIKVASTETATSVPTETATSVPTETATSVPTETATSMPTITTAPKLTNSIDVFVQFELGVKVKTFEVSPAGRNIWEDYSSDTIVKVCQNTFEEKEFNPSFRMRIYDNNNVVDFRVNGSVVWKNIKIIERRLIVIGYDNGPFVGAYIDNFANDIGNC